MSFKLVIAASLMLLVGRVALAGEITCPPDCPVKGGGPKATDCLLEFGGVTATEEGGRVVECHDGDFSCDHNPNPGVCGFQVQACVNNADPSLPTCTATGVERVNVRGGGAQGRALGQAISSMLPTTENKCTDPVQLDIPVYASGYTDDSPPLGSRHFSLSFRSTFGINTLPSLATFEGFIDFEGGKVDPHTGLALINVTGSSEYLSADINLGLRITLCVKPVTPVIGAGVIACGKRSPGGRAIRVTAGNESATDRDGLLLSCRAEVNYTTSITIDRNLGIVGEDGFTEEDCTAAMGTVDEDTGICTSGFITGQLPEFSSNEGEMILAPFAGLAGFPVEITQESAPPCGDEEPSNGMSVAIALTTQHSASTILDANGTDGNTISFGVEGEPFDCEHFSTEDGPGALGFSAPQLGLPLLGDGATLFRFVDN